MAGVFALAGLVGLYLAFESGWIVLLIGLAAIFSAIAYTGGPFPLSYYGLGDLFVFCSSGWLPWRALTLCRSARSARPPGRCPCRSAWSLSAFWWLTTCATSRRTAWPVNIIGGTAGRAFAWLSISPVSRGIPVPAVFAPLGCCLGERCLPWLAFPLAGKLTRIVFTQTGQALNVALAGTGQLALAYSVLFMLGLLLAG